ncbi:MAG TPA: zinc-binding alcohol dehydrogenase [bacterium]|nr:zinc-binding alcohol dehydrogenase [bacterium]HOL36008.1 zinc-binding alcohol dehydrogenase [bacterium]HPP08859.1 zinc-binding alcohol dehydrogenase [bacterium]
MKTTAIVFEDVEKVEIKEIEIPEMENDEIMVDVMRTGVSVGTERWALSGLRPDTVFPLVPGYQGIGRVINTGEKVSDIEIGDIVYFVHSRVEKPYSSWSGTHLSTAIVKVNPYCVKIGRKLDEQEINCLALSALAAVSCRGIEMAKVSLGEKCLVVGLGFIGQMACQIMKLKGCEVVGADVIEKRVKIAKKYSCDEAINVGGKTFVEEIKKISHFFDIIIDTTGSDRMLNEEIHLLKFGGKFVWQGWYPGESKINYHNFHAKLATVYMPCYFTAEALRQSIKWIAERKLTILPLITTVASYKMAKEVYSKILNEPSEILGVIFNWEK